MAHDRCQFAADDHEDLRRRAVAGQGRDEAHPLPEPLERPKSFGLVSSDENVLRPRDGNARVTIPPNGVEYLRLYFPAVHRRGMLQCLLYVNSEHDQSEEVFLLRLLVA